MSSRLSSHGTQTQIKSPQERGTQSHSYIEMWEHGPSLLCQNVEIQSYLVMPNYGNMIHVLCKNVAIRYPFVMQKRCNLINKQTIVARTSIFSIIIQS